MNLIVGFTLLLLMVSSTHEYEAQIVGPDRVQDFHACVLTTAYIPWPLNVIARGVHKANVITLTFQRRYSEKKMVIATFNSRRELIADKLFKDRLVPSSENSGVFLEKITYDDAGTYIAQARLASGQVWTRTTNLTVYMRPIVHEGRLNVTQSEIITKNARTHCVNITCGTLEYAGYPPVKFVWTTMSGTLAVKMSPDESSSSVQICSPYSGDVTCAIAGFSSVCTYDHVTTVHLDLPGPPANSSTVASAVMTRELVLIIVMPILVVLIPLIILGVWVLRHLLKSYPHYREQRHYEKKHKAFYKYNRTTSGSVLYLPMHVSTSREPQADVDIEDNMTTEQTHNIDDELMSELDDEQTETKEEIKDSDEENHLGELENNNDHYHHHYHHHHDADNGQADSGNYGDNDNGESTEGEIDEEDEDDDDHKTNEEQPLMDDSVSPIV